MTACLWWEVLNEKKKTMLMLQQEGHITNVNETESGAPGRGYCDSPVPAEAAMRQIPPGSPDVAFSSGCSGRLFRLCWRASSSLGGRSLSLWAAETC